LRIQGVANEASTAAAATEAVSSSTASLCTLAAGRSVEGTLRFQRNLLEKLEEFCYEWLVVTGTMEF